jgi:uroporphyrinogen III methyltransferase / synthase
MSAARPGTVYLVGAGPGDPGLLTVRARALLDDCDAIVYDALVSPALWAAPRPPSSGVGGRPAPELHQAGKRGGDPASARQDDITALLIRLARAGKSVVRLKGGDPFVFGRGGEEAAALAAAGLSFEVVPGVTAGIAGPAYAGIPVTHRGLATVVALVTGHEDAAKGEPQTDWGALARAGGTIVLYMGVRRLPAIAAALIAGGLAPDTPAAAIEQATYPTQRTIVGTVATVAERAAAAGLEAPVITVIGRVVALRETIAWFEGRDPPPLLGRGVVVTRATGQASALAERLRSLGAAVLEMPATRIEPLDPAPLAAALARLSDYRHIVFTSQNAARIVWDALRATGRDARALAGLTVSAVGPATAEVLLERGIAVDIVPDRFVAEGVLAAYAARSDVRGSRILYPAAEGARGLLSEGLGELGAAVDVVPVYRSVPDGTGADALRAAIAGGGLDLVTLTSASGVRGYVDAVGPDLAGRLPAASIGPITSHAARSAGVPVVVEAGESTIAGLVDAIVSLAWPPAGDGGVDGDGGRDADAGACTETGAIERGP